MSKKSRTMKSKTSREDLRKALLSWFDQFQREMPWRHVDNPYAVWVSEVMLQQTRVTTVVEYFHRWMERFPTVESLASAPVEDVLEIWSGLGYYRRARHLHRAAATVVDEFGGELPREVSKLRKLSGVGPYTAGAIASIAFGQVEPLVDGNVTRVICRLYARGGDPTRSTNQKWIWAKAKELVDPERPGDFNQGLMELGSEICRARNPKCPKCPLQGWCKGLADGEAERYPEVVKKAPQKPMRGATFVVHRRPERGGGRQFLLRRRPAQGLLAGLWEFPSAEAQGKSWPGIGELSAELSVVTGAAVDEVGLGRPLGQVEHVFSHRRLKVRVYDVETSPQSPPPQTDEQKWRWVEEAQLSEVATSALVGKIEQLWRVKIAES